MDAVEYLVTSGRQVVLGIVGTEALREFVVRRNGNEPVPWLRVLDPTDDVAALYQAASVFLSASRSEGFPYSVCEAMANNLPTVVSDLPGVAWARNTPGAAFFPVGNSRALAAAICDVLAWTDEDRSRRVRADSRYVSDNHSVESWADNICDLYEEMLYSLDPTDCKRTAPDDKEST